MNDSPRPEMPHAELMCVLCGLIVVMTRYGGSYPSRCVANGGGDHIHPSSPAAQQAKEIRAAWLRDPMGTVAGENDKADRGIAT